MAKRELAKVLKAITEVNNVQRPRDTNASVTISEKKQKEKKTTCSLPAVNFSAGRAENIGIGNNWARHYRNHIIKAPVC
jgi:hypothetical protein